MIASPTWLKASDSDDALKAKPVGTGPFIFESYAPNESFKAKREPELLEHALSRTSTRSSSVPSPTPSTAETRWRAAACRSSTRPTGETIADARETRTSCSTSGPTRVATELHAAARHAGCRTVRLAADRPAGALRAGQRLRQPDDHRHRSTPASTRSPTARSRPSQVGYLQETGLPAAAGHGEGQGAHRRLQGRAPRPAHLSLATTQDETNLTIAQFQKQWWEDAGVDDVSIDQIDQGNYIVTALLGTSRSSSGATTAASTSTSSTSGGTPRPHFPSGSWR